MKQFIKAGAPLRQLLWSHMCLCKYKTGYYCCQLSQWSQDFICQFICKCDETYWLKVLLLLELLLWAKLWLVLLLLVLLSPVLLLLARLSARQWTALQRFEQQRAARTQVL
jgi:hypothetical protein